MLPQKPKCPWRNSTCFENHSFKENVIYDFYYIRAGALKTSQKYFFQYNNYFIHLSLFYKLRNRFIEIKALALGQRTVSVKFELFQLLALPDPTQGWKSSRPIFIVRLRIGSALLKGNLATCANNIVTLFTQQFILGKL